MKIGNMDSFEKKERKENVPEDTIVLKFLCTIFTFFNDNS